MTSLGAFLIYAGVAVIAASLFDRYRDRWERKRAVEGFIACFYRNRRIP